MSLYLEISACNHMVSLTFPFCQAFFTLLPLPSPKKVCGELLIRSILVLLFSVEIA
jgi:hypothetical protein